MMPVANCWRVIGVYGGDRSCELLNEHVHCRSCPVFSQAGRALLDRPQPPASREEATHNVAPMPPATSRTRGVFMFRIAQEWFALPLPSMLEVTELKRAHRVPHRSHKSLAGIVNVRGQLLLCASLHGLLELPASAAVASTARVVHFSTGREDWTFVADEVFGIADVSESDFKGVPVSLSMRASAFTTALFDHDGRHVALLNPSIIGDELRREVG
jgi:chemotaxis-related protein WspD